MTTAIHLFFELIICAFLVLGAFVACANIYMELFNFKTKRFRHFKQKCDVTISEAKKAYEIGQLDAIQHNFFFNMLAESEKTRKENQEMISKVKCFLQQRAIIVTGSFKDAEAFAKTTEGEEMLSKIKDL